MDKNNWLLAVFCSIIFLCLGFFTVFYDNDMPDLTYAYSVYGKDVTDMMHHDVYEYLYYGDALSDSHFSEEERAHMKDVRLWTLRLHYIFFGALMIVGVMLYRFDRLGINMLFFRNYSLLTIVGVILAVLVSIWFSSVFDIFHKIFFVSNYSFPLGSPLVTMYTYDFFRLAGLRIFGVWITSGVVSALVWLAWKFKNHS